MSLRREWWILPVCVATAAYFVAVWVAGATPGGGAFDIYMHYYPNMVYAARQVWSGGGGLLWNPLQNCGQPFFAISTTALLYPTTWFFWFLDPNTALRAVTLFNLTVGGIGAYGLGRELGVRPAAALCGALSFELGNATLDMSTWSPMVGSPYVWLPAALWCCERSLRAPSVRSGIALALTLTMALLTGFPQPILLGYQLIALRVAWELVTRRAQRPAAMLIAVGIGLVLPPLLAAVHFFPSAELASRSVRGAPLTMAEMLRESPLTWASFGERLDKRAQIFIPLLFLPLVIGAASVWSTATRRVALFYLGTGLLYLALAFGPKTFLFDWYLALPAGHTFRGPARFQWMTSFCLAVLAALGAEVLMRRDTTRTTLGQRLILCVPLVLAVVGFDWLAPSGLRPAEWVLAGCAIGAVIAMSGRSRRRWATALLLLTVVVNLCAFQTPLFPTSIRQWAVRQSPNRTLVGNPDSLRRNAPILDWLHTHLSPQERVYINGAHGKFWLMPKSASLFGFRGIHDYEPAPDRRWAGYQVMLLSGQAMIDLNSFYYRLATGLPSAPLLNLAAGRYLLIEANLEAATRATARYRTRYRGRTVALFENPDALPRAFYVPRIEVLPNSDEVLQRLAAGKDPPTQVAFVEEMPASGFSGGATVPGATSAVDFVTDDPEHLVLRVQAPQRGFLHLADQYYPGWVASVNGAAMPILRGNFIFRLVEVPAGESIVEFRFAPMSVRFGAGVSLLSALTLIGLAFVTRPRHRE